MPYTKLHEDWSNLPSVATPINADALEHIEDGIATAQDGVDNLDARVDTLESTTGQVSQAELDDETAARIAGDNALDVRVDVLESAGPPVGDHGALTGLGDDDHPQYALDASLAPVATSGVYNDLTGKPTLGTAAAAATGDFATAAQGATADAAIPKATLDANTLLGATVDNTPIPFPVAASRVVGRKATGDIDDLTPAEVAELFGTPDGTKFLADDGTLKVPAGGGGGIVWDPVAEVYDDGRIFVGPEDPETEGYTPDAHDFWLNPDLLPSNVGRLLAYHQFTGASDGAAAFSTTSTSMVDVDATNLAITFPCPDSGQVLLKVSAAVREAGGNNVFLGFREASSNVAGTSVNSTAGANVNRGYYTVRVSGLTPGTVYTYKLAFRCDAGTAQIWSGPNRGPVTIEVWDAASGNGVIHPLVDDDSFAAATAANVPSAESVAAYVTSRGMVLISDQTLGSAASTIDFSSIPPTFKELRLVFQGRSARAGQASDVLGIRFNNDATATYRTPHLSGSGVAASSGVDAASGFMPTGEVPGATGTASTPGMFEAIIPNYAGTTFHKTALIRSGDTNGTTEQVRSSYGRWTNTAAVNRLTIVSANGANLVIGSRATLYGIA